MYHILLISRGDFIKFIFPQNYNFKSKLFGVIDYATAIFCLVWSIIVLSILNLIFDSITVIISLCIILILPVIIFCIVGFNGENIGIVIKYILFYLLKPKIYVFNKKY